MWLYLGASGLLMILFRVGRALQGDSRQAGRNSEVIYYRTRDGAADYGFSIERCGPGLRVYITAQPPYGKRDESGHVTHRLTDSDGRRYVCWDSIIPTRDAALSIAARWADSTQEYIRSGKGF